MKRITAEDIEQMRRSGYDKSTIADAEAWMLLGRKADLLAQQMINAFAGVTLGNGIGLRESDGIDDYAGSEQLQKLRAADEKLDWQKITPELLQYCNAAPSFLDAEGMRFHAPAFIVAELRGLVEVGFMDRLIFHSFGAPEFIDLLTPEQRHAIMACISFYGSISILYNSNHISEALIRYANAGGSIK